ncbi:SFC1 [Symbiodinium sp. CCMP2592]|nr:SFC1 [Symbiodinium sp. CCMP2592]
MPPPPPPRVRGSLLSQTKSCTNQNKPSRYSSLLGARFWPVSAEAFRLPAGRTTFGGEGRVFFVSWGGVGQTVNLESEDRLQVHHGMDRCKILPWFMLHDMVNSGLVVAADGLARFYNRVLDERELKPPYLPLQCPVEELHECFPSPHFDVVHIRNALDHSFDPVLGIQRMLQVTRPGGWVLLRHARNEGVPGQFRNGQGNVQRHFFQPFTFCRVGVAQQKMAVAAAQPAQVASPTSIALPKKKAHWAVSFLAGFCSGATEVSVTMPLDTVKTYCQVNRTGLGPVAGAQQIYQLKGIHGFYFGLPAVLVQVAGKGAIRFTAFEQFKFLLQYCAPKPSVDFLAGIGAGFAEAFLWTTPTERLKVLRQNDIKSGLNRYSSLVGSIRTVASDHGIRGLYAGIGATGIRQASGVGVRFALYGHVKSALTTDPPQMWQSAVAGGITGCCSTLLNNPIDVIKSRIEAQDGNTKEYTSTLQAFRSILQQEGAMAFYKGIAPRLMKISIGQAITFSAYEAYSSAFSSLTGL